MKKKHFDFADLTWVKDGKGKKAELNLLKGQTAYNPGTTCGRKIHGPAHLVYKQFPDGGVDVMVTPTK